MIDRICNLISYQLKQLTDMRHKDFLIWAKEYLPKYCKDLNDFDKVYKILKNPNGDFDSAKTWIQCNFTPFIIAAADGFLEEAKYLLAKGSDIYATCAQSSTVLEQAAMEGSLHVIKYLEKEYNFNIDTVSPKDNTTPIFFAAWKGRLEVVKYLYSKGADIENTNSVTGNTPLIQAALSGHYDVVKFLGDNGAKLEAQDNSERTALSWASIKGFPEITDYLLSKNVDPNIGDRWGSTALHRIIESFPKSYLEREGEDGDEDKFVEIQFSIIKSLLDHNANPNIKSDIYGTVYELATSYSHVAPFLKTLCPQKEPQDSIKYPDAKSLDKELTESHEQKAAPIDKRLCWSDAGLRDNVLDNMAELISSGYLEALEIDGNKFTDAGMKIFFDKLRTEIRLCRLELKELNFADNQIGDDGAKYLSKIIAANGKLEILNLDGNKISNQGIKYLAKAMERNTHLTELYLDDNDIIPNQITRKYLEQLNQKLEANLDAATQAAANKIEHKNNEPIIIEEPIIVKVNPPNETTNDQIEHNNNEPIIVEVVEIRKPSAPPLPPPAPSAPAGSIIDEIAGNCQNTNDPQNEDGIEAAGAIADIPGGYNW